MLSSNLNITVNRWRLLHEIRTHYCREDLLKEQWKHLTDKLEKKYESLDKLANEIATKRFESHIKAQVDPVYEKITKLHTILGEVETSLYDLVPESITNEI